MKSFRIAVTLLLLAGTAHAPVYAQSINLLGDQPTKSSDDVEREKLIEKDYKESLKKIPNAKASNDPWSNVRAAETPAAPVAPVKGAKGKQVKPAANPQ